MNQRLRDNQKKYLIFSQINPLQSLFFINKEFLVLEKITNNTGAEKANIFLVKSISSGEICVLKIVKLDQKEQKYVQKAYSQNSRKGTYGKHNYLRYSCWSELNLFRITREILLQQRSPCFPFMFTSFIVQSIENNVCDLSILNQKNEDMELKLVYCMEYLSRTTLRKWLHAQIIQSRHWHQLTRQEAISIAKRQFSLLFFHIFAALYVLHTLGFSHNDLHLDNILIVHSKETCKNFVYSIQGKKFIVANDLGECLKQLPIVCDFGTSSDLAHLHNVSFQEHFHQTHQCSYHKTQGLQEKCNFTQFCDVFRILNDIKSEIDMQANCRDLLCSFEPFEKLRLNLQLRFLNRCSEQDSFLQKVIFSNYEANIVSSMQDFILFECDKNIK